MKLTIELVPQTSWNNNLRSLMQPEHWNILRKKILASTDGSCAICGNKGILHCHEVWEYNDEEHVQTLTGIIPICTLCHGVKHIGHTKLQSHEWYEKVIAHFMKINKCTRIEFETYKNKMFEQWGERSKFEWRIDIGENKGVNFLV